jgi:DNA mismatch endonuclease, patch repair protein
MKPTKHKGGVPSFKGLAPATHAARKAAKGSSKKTNTKCELVLRRALRSSGLRFSLASSGLLGRPDLVFRRQRLAIFCDGDFWHGRKLKQRLARLERGHNSAYWLKKIQSNVSRDRRITKQLRQEGWRVLRIWETDIHLDIEKVVTRVRKHLA